MEATPEVKKYLASKVQSDGGNLGSGTIYNIILNINGKEYPNCGGFGPDDSDDDNLAGLSFCSGRTLPPTSSVPPLKQGETYYFSFK
jgi:hypothetical protein